MQKERTHHAKQSVGYHRSWTFHLSNKLVIGVEMTKLNQWDFVAISCKDFHMHRSLDNAQFETSMLNPNTSVLIKIVQQSGEKPKTHFRIENQ